MGEAEAGGLRTLVSTEELARHPGWRVFDCRHDLAKPDLGEQLYRQSHIPGARFAHLDRDLSAPKTGKNGRHPLPDPQKFIAWLGAQGLKPGDPVVCYDGGGGSMASRLWWMLRWVGHDAVAVLDGGFAKWTREGRPASAEVPAFAATTYPANVRADMAIDADHVLRNLGKEAVVDARAPVRWRGEKEPIDPEAGRIPGSLNRFNGDNLTPEGVHKDAVTLKKEFEALLGRRNPAEVAHSCGSGVAACHNLLAMEIAGLQGAKLYAGSWSEWIADPSRPRERG
jgi:thiosulfate/3-mercaptopyruvate sulfurtransferase